MQKTAFGILLVGFVFVCFQIQLFGIDLLIDAVGFSLIFNGIRPLRKTMGGFLYADLVCLALVLVTALQLFISGPFGVVLALVRSVLEIFVFAGLAQGVYKWLQKQNHKKLGLVAVGVFGLGAVMAMLQGVLIVAGTGLQVWQWAYHLYAMVLLACLLGLILLPGSPEDVPK